MSEDQITDELDTNFATVVADGAYAHFLDGFVSLLFYQIRSYPIDNQSSDLKIKRKREIIADIRISLNQLKRLLNDLQEGIDFSPTMKLFDSKSGFISRSNQLKGEDVKDLDLRLGAFSSEEVENIQNNLLQDNYEKLSEEGKKKYLATMIEAVMSKSDELRDIVEKDLESKEVKKDVRTKTKSK